MPLKTATRVLFMQSCITLVTRGVQIGYDCERLSIDLQELRNHLLGTFQYKSGHLNLVSEFVQHQIKTLPVSIEGGMIGGFYESKKISAVNNNSVGCTEKNSSDEDAHTHGNNFDDITRQMIHNRLLATQQILELSYESYSLIYKEIEYLIRGIESGFCGEFVRSVDEYRYIAPEIVIEDQNTYIDKRCIFQSTLSSEMDKFTVSKGVERWVADSTEVTDIVKHILVADLGLVERLRLDRQSTMRSAVCIPSMLFSTSDGLQILHDTKSRHNPREMIFSQLTISIDTITGLESSQFFYELRRLVDRAFFGWVRITSRLMYQIETLLIPLRHNLQFDDNLRHVRELLSYEMQLAASPKNIVDDELSQCVADSESTTKFGNLISRFSFYHWRRIIIISNLTPLHLIEELLYDVEFRITRMKNGHVAPTLWVEDNYRSPLLHNLRPVYVGHVIKQSPYDFICWRRHQGTMDIFDSIAECAYPLNTYSPGSKELHNTDNTIINDIRNTPQQKDFLWWRGDFQGRVVNYSSAPSPERDRSEENLRYIIREYLQMHNQIVSHLRGELFGSGDSMFDIGQDYIHKEPDRMDKLLETHHSHPRFLIYSCSPWTMCGGHGDRVNGIITTFLISIVSGRVFLINDDSPIHIGLLKRPNLLDWRFSPLGEISISDYHNYVDDRKSLLRDLPMILKDDRTVISITYNLRDTGMVLRSAVSTWGEDSIHMENSSNNGQIRTAYADKNLLRLAERLTRVPYLARQILTLLFKSSSHLQKVTHSLMSDLSLLHNRTRLGYDTFRGNSNIDKTGGSLNIDFSNGFEPFIAIHIRTGNRSMDKWWDPKRHDMEDIEEFLSCAEYVENSYFGRGFGETRDSSKTPMKWFLSTDTVDVSDNITIKDLVSKGKIVKLGGADHIVHIDRTMDIWDLMKGVSLVYSEYQIIQRAVAVITSRSFYGETAAETSPYNPLVFFYEGCVRTSYVSS